MTERHHLQLLGVPKLVDQNGHAIRFQSKKDLALLIYLMLETGSGPVTREKLASLLWPGSTKNPLHSLSQALSDIRCILGSDAVASERTQVRLQVDITTDLDLYSLESLPRRIPTPFEGLESYAGSDFALWVHAERDRTLLQIENTLRERLREARAYGRVQAVSERAEQLYSLDPYDEEAIQALIGDRVYSGNLAAAIRLFQKHAEDSRMDLGRSPSVETMASLRRLERRVLEHPQHGDSPKGVRLPRKSQPEVFIGRESQMARLEALSSQVIARAQFRSCLLRGPGGVGKTTVLRRFVSTAVGGIAPVYMVNCQKIGQGLPFAAVSDLLEQMSRDPSLGGTDPMWLSEASRIAPGIRAAYDSIPEPPVTQPETARVRLGQAIKHMLEAVADGGPVILAFDDLHYMDPASRDVLHMLARRLDGTPALLVATARSAETDTGLGDGEGTNGVDWQETIDLHWLENSEIAKLVSALTKSDESATEAVRHKIVELADGSPLLTEMLVSDWHKSGENSLVMVNIRGVRDHVNWCPPDIMRSAFTRQYDGLSKCAQRLVNLLATAGRSMRLEDVCRLLAVPSETVGGAVFALIERSIVSLEGNALGFRNDMHRAFVYASLPDETRKYQHAHLAQHLRAAKDQSDFQHALEASFHFLKAGWITEATELACVGSERAITSGAPKEAIKALEAVIAANPKNASTPLHLCLARARIAVGQYRDALTTLDAWKPEQPTQEEEALAATIRVEALHRGRLGDDETIKQALDHAMHLTEKSGVDSLFVSALQLSAEWASETGDSEALDSVRARTQRIGESTKHTATKALARLSQGYCLLVEGEVQKAETEFRKCIKPLRELHLDPELRRVYNGIGICCYCLGAMDKATSAFGYAIDLATRIGDSIAAATSWSNMGVVHEDLGSFDDAQKCYELALSLGETAANPRRAVEFHLNVAGLQLVTGDLASASLSIDIAHGWADASKLWWLTTDVLLAEADTCLASKRPDLAWSLLEKAQRAMRGRVYALSNRGRYERLRRHQAFVTQGLSTMLRISETESLDRQCVQITDRLEVRAFEDWARMQGNPIHRTKSSSYEELEARGLLGVLRRMEALGYSIG